MIISEIQLDNIRSHKRNSIEFTPGINVITGNTGSGKSSVLMSIEYALFGKIGEGREEGKMLLRRNSNEGSIAIKLINNNDEYEIKRGLKRVGDSVRNDDSKNYIIKNDKKIDLQNRASDINSYVNKILKIESENPLKMFETITYIKQDELKNLIFETGQYKQEYIDGLLQLNKYLDVYESTRDLITKIKNEIELNKKEIELGIDENEIIRIETKINENKNVIEALKNGLEENRILLENKTIEKKQKESELEFERNKKIDFEKMSTEIKLKNNEKIKLENEITKIKQKIEDANKNFKAVERNEKNELEKAIKNLEEITKTKSDELKKLYQDFFQLEYSYKNAQKEEENLSNEKTSENLKIKTLTEEAAKIKKRLETALEIENKEEIAGRIKELKTKSDELKKEMEDSIKSGFCVMCGNKITDISHVKTEYETKIKKCQDSITELKGISDNIKYSKKDLENQLEIIKMKIDSSNEILHKVTSRLSELKIEEKKTEYEIKKDNYKKYSDELEELLSSLKKAREELQKVQEQEKLAIEVENYNNRINEIEKAILNYIDEIKYTEDRLAGIKFDEEELKKKENGFKLTIEEINKINYKITEIKKETEMREKQILEDKGRLEEVKIKIKKREEIIKTLNKKEDLLKIISNLREDIRSIREYVRLKFINEFKSLFKARFEELRNENDYLLDIDNNYNVIINAGNEETDARALSGGEKTSVAIAYRLALSSLASILGGVGKNELILMDEPTSGLDKEDINALTSAITKITDLKQIVIVTHEDSMKNIADRVIKLKKEAGVSTLY
ncbi:MAG: SMC family ATPase [Candidatus Parvarchaeota archaeon]|jgi:exonuclease SbcC|nr:SMC family ATPase [Candidatus Parvarchaeota archaeon]